MQRIEAKIFTGSTVKKKQKEWFERNGYRYAVDDKGDVYTTDDWMNLKDKGHTVVNDDGFDLEFLDYAEPNEWLDEHIDSLVYCQHRIFSDYYLFSEKTNNPAVYVLFKGLSVVYVGQCKNLRKRINQHNHNGVIDYDAFRVIPNIPLTSFKHVEALYINLFEPKFNQEIPLLCKTAKKFVEEHK